MRCVGRGLCQNTIFNGGAMALRFNSFSINQRKKEVYIPTLAELRKIEVRDNGEPMVSLNELEPSIVCYSKMEDMFPYTGKQIFVRSFVRDKLLAMQKELTAFNSKMKLLIYYGYRHPQVQKFYFEEIGNKIKKEGESPALFEERVNLFIAHPSVAGHPTGGAIDASIVLDGEELDMGGKIFDFDQPKKIVTFSEEISEAQLANRMLLLDLFQQAGFAPFYGEWWHFSYGDREWAMQSQAPHACYSQIDFDLYPNKSKEETSQSKGLGFMPAKNS